MHLYGTDRKLLLCLCLFLIGCDRKAPVDDAKSGGLKNMALPSASDIVKENIENEPNDTPDKAAELRLTGDEVTAAAVLTPSDTDCWLLRSKAGTVAALSAGSENKADFVISVYGSDVTQAKFAIDNQFADLSYEIVPNLKLLPEGSVVCVKARNKEALPYMIKLQRLPSSPLPEEEPNNVDIDAQILQVPSHVAATVQQSGDVDTYKIAAFKDSILKIRAPNVTVEATVSLNGTNVWKSLLTPKSLASCALDPSKQHYHLKIQATEVIDAIEPYAIFLEDRTSGESELEPNNSPESAQRLTAGDKILHFTLSDSQDVDCFDIQAATDKDALLFLRLQSEASLSAKIVRNGNVLKTHKAENSYTVLCRQEIKTSENVSLCVSVNPDNVATLPTAYGLQAQIDSPEFYENESNDAYDLASPLPPGSRLKANIFPKNDVDIFVVDIADNVPGTFNLYTESGYIAGLQIRLTDETQGEIARVQSKEFSKELRLSADLPPGKYYAVVTGTGDDCMKPYTIHSQFVPKEEKVETPPVPSENIPADIAPQNPPQPQNTPDDIRQLLDSVDVPVYEPSPEDEF